jgi:putative transcriptional regulator
MKIPSKAKRASQASYLEGQLLVAMPQQGDDRFDRAIIFICAHSDEGAMGIILNKPMKQLHFPQLLVQLDIIKEEDAISLPGEAEQINVLRGGPVENGRGFVLHTPDFFIDNTTLAVTDNICLTVTVDILRAIAHGNGPDHAALALGYAGWDAGQLETEIQRNDWLTSPADHDLVFDRHFDTKYQRALAKVGVDLSMLSSDAGHA